MTTAHDLIRLLKLEPLPEEGGFFRRTWTSVKSWGKDTAGESLPGASAIHYLLTVDSYSAIHRLDHEELYFFHAGDPAEIYHFEDSGGISRHVLGHRVDQGETLQHRVPAGVWQASRLVPGKPRFGYTLLSTVMCPGFTWASFQLGRQKTMLATHPEHRKLVLALSAAEENPPA